MEEISNNMIEIETDYDTVENCLKTADLRDKAGLKTQVLDFLKMALNLYLVDHKEDKFVADIYKRIGENLRDLKCFYISYGYLMNAHDIYKRICGINSEEVAKSFLGLGDYFSLKEDFYNAITYYSEGIKKLGIIYGEDSKELAPYEVVLARSYDLASSIKQSFIEKSSYLEEVILHYKKALDLYRKYYDSNDIMIANILINMGDVFKKIQRADGDNEWDKAIIYWNEAVGIYIANYGEMSLEVANLFYSLGCAVRNFKINNDRALLRFEDKSNDYLYKALKIFKAIGLEDSEISAKTIYKIGKNYLRHKDEKAIECFEKKLDIYKKIFGEDDDRLEKCYLDLMDIYDRFDKEDEYKKIEVDYDEMYKRQHPFTIEEGKITPEQCIKLAENHVKDGQLNIANDYYKKAANLFYKKDATKEQADVYLQIAYNHINNNYHIQNAVDYLKKAVDIYKEIGCITDQEFAKIYYDLANECIRTAQYNAAIENIKYAKEYYQKDDDNIENLAKCNVIIALAYENLENYVMAGKFFKEAITKAEELKELSVIIPRSYLEIANCYEKSNLIRDAIHYCVKAKDAFCKIKDKYEVEYVRCYLMMGKYCSAVHLYDKALEYLLEGVYKISLENYQNDITKEMCSTIADIYLNQHNIRLVAKWREKAILVQKYTYPTQYLSLASLLESVEEYEKAAFYYEKAVVRAKDFGEIDAVSHESYTKMFELFRKCGLNYAADWIRRQIY